MTNKEFYATVAMANISDEITEKANQLLASMEKQAANSANARRRKTEEQSAPVQAAILDFLHEHGPSIASAIAESTDATVSKVSAVARSMVKAGVLTSVDLRVKSRIVKQFAIADNTESAEEPTEETEE